MLTRRLVNRNFFFCVGDAARLVDQIFNIAEATPCRFADKILTRRILNSICKLRSVYTQLK